MTKDINLRPLDDRVVVEPMEAEEMTAGGIVLARHGQGKAAARHRAGGRARASCWTTASAASSRSPSATK